MNLTVGCCEVDKGTSIYYLRDGTKLDKQEWIDLVEQHVIDHHNSKELKKIENTVKLWNRFDTIHELALQVYASKYCTNLEIDLRRRNTYKQVKDEMGCNQLSFY